MKELFSSLSATVFYPLVGLVFTKRGSKQIWNACANDQDWVARTPVRTR
jgi:hypothetical protein